MTEYTVVFTPNEDEVVGGFFAHFVWDPDTRGHGSTELSALLCLTLVVAENEGIDLGEQAGDLVISLAMPNTDLEEALEKRYGGRIDYHR